VVAPAAPVPGFGGLLVLLVWVIEVSIRIGARWV
jgi:hypothetical protein